MINVNSGREEVINSMVITILSDTQMESPGKLLVRSKSKRTRILIDLILYPLALMVIWKICVELIHENSVECATVCFVIGAVIATAVFLKMFKCHKCRCRCQLTIYENGISGRGIIDSFGEEEKLSDIKMGKKVLYSIDFQRNYIKIEEGLDGQIEDIVRFYYLKGRGEVEVSLRELLRTKLDD